MKLFNEADPAPNPRRVRIFLKEKGVDIDLVPTPLTKGAHKSPEHLARNPLDQVPVLELEDGSRSIPHFRRLTSISPTLKISSTATTPKTNSQGERR